MSSYQPLADTNDIYFAEYNISRLNLFNPNDADFLKGGYLGGGTTLPVWVNDSNHCESGYIPIMPNERLYWHLDGSNTFPWVTTAIYDEKKNYIENINPSILGYIENTGTKVKYIRISVHINDIDRLMINAIPTMDYYVPYNPLGMGVLSSENVYNKDDKDIIINKYISSEGEIRTYDGISESGFIPVKPNEVYYWTSGETTIWPWNAVTFFNRNKEYVTGIGNPSTTGYVVVPNNNAIVYMRISVAIAEMSTLVISKWHNVVKYVPYFDGKGLIEKILNPSDAPSETKIATYYETERAVRECCYINKCYFIDAGGGLGWARIKNDTTYTLDNIHQSNLGGYIFAEAIWRELKTIPTWKLSVPSSHNANNGEQWNGLTWYAYGTSITSITQGKYAPYVAEMAGLNLVNKGIPGGGIGDLGGYSHGQVRTAIMNTTDGKLDADLITLEVTANDTGDNVPLGTIYDTGNDTLLGCLNQCIRYLQENTNAQIVVFTSVASTTIPS